MIPKCSCRSDVGTLRDTLARDRGGHAAEHEVYITDWADAREVPIYEGRFDLNSFIDYLIEFIHTLGPQTHVIAVCQPAVPALAATAIMQTTTTRCSRRR